ALAADRGDPMEDPRASAAYRRQLVRVLGARVLERAFERAGARQC
ncbi:MAG: xanthine dehydrogenase family protein subunit M, partial [Rhodospirillaceae bacterium]|nr:xanthine dehydrogenase family protein subunit M [Rhodospirillaceae bacterium]